MRQIISPLDGFRSPFGARRGGFSPAALFALAEPGVWYDPSDLTTLFQDTAGTTPVTTPGQTVALALDKSKGLVLGSELVTNGDFSNGTTGWLGGAGNISGGFLVWSAVANNSGIFQSNASYTGGFLEITVVVSSISSGAVTVTLGIGTPTSSNCVNITTAGTHTFRQGNFFGDNTLRVYSVGASTTATIDSVSVKQVTGFHATQATLASRPTYGIVPFGGRRNLLTRTEEFSNADWTLDNSGAVNPTVTANFAAAPNGTLTADRIQLNKTGGLYTRIQQTRTLPLGVYTFSVWLRNNISGTANVGLRVGNTGVNCAVTETWQRFSVTLSPASTVADAQIILFDTIPGNDETADILAWGAQLETGSSATAYQRVGSAFDVTEAGVASLSYLSFDGIDDHLVTPTVSFSTDKMTVFAGLRKLSDAATAILLESSAAIGGNNGAIALFAPGVSSSTDRFTFASKGTGSAFSVATSSTFAAPVTSVVTGIGDIAGDISRVRANGVQQAENTADQGSGNYLAYPLYIGRRAGTSLPFNGQLFSLIVRNAATDAATITSSETWVAGKTGVTL